MNDAQRREFQQIRDEQNALVARFSRLEARLDALQMGLDAPPIPPPVSEPAKFTTPPPMPPPVAPPLAPPPLPAEAFRFPVRDDAPPLSSVPPALSEAAVPPPMPAAPAAPKESLEVRIGTTWLVRIGVVALLTGLVFVGSYLYKNIVPHLGAAAKVALMYLGAGALAGAGAFLERGKEAAKSPRMLNFARVVLAGGLAAVYYVTYAAHWNPNLLVLRDPWVDGALLIGWTAFMVWLADRRGSEVLATFAILLAYYASAVNEVVAFTLFSNLSLTVAAVYLLRRHLWRVFPYASLLATYGSYGFWSVFHALVRQRIEGPGSAHAIAGRGGMWIEGAFLLLYWLLFTGTAFFPGAGGWSARRRGWFVSLNNVAFFALTTWLLLSEYPGSFWKWSLGFGAVLCALAEACRWVRPRLDRETEGAYFVQGLVLVTVGFCAYFGGWQLSLVLAAQSVVLLGRALVREERLPLWGSLATGVASFVVAANQLADWQTPVPWVPAAGAAGLLVFAAWWSQYWLDRPAAVPAPGEVVGPDFRATLAVAPAFFSALGIGIGWWLIERTLAGHDALIPTLAVVAAVLMASIYVLRVRAVPFYALALLAAALLHRFATDDLTGPFTPAVPGWSMGILLAATLAAGHWWQRRWPWTAERLRPADDVAKLIAGLIAAAGVLLIYDWLRPTAHGITAAQWVALNAVVSLALLAYGLKTRYLALAGVGQGLLAASLAGCESRVWLATTWPGGFGTEPLLTLVPLAVLLATIYAGRRYFNAGQPRESVCAVLAFYEGAATLFFLGWGMRYIPTEARFVFFSVAGALVVVWAQIRRELRWRWCGGALTAVGVAWLVCLRIEDRANLLQLLGVAAMAGQQQFARRFAARQPAAALSVRWQGVCMVLATLCAWIILNAFVSRTFGGSFTLAAAWSLFAAGVFAAGLLLREKMYRWLGLGILVCTIGRIAIVDIWQLDSLGRAVSAMCLGAVLLGIGYFYNRFHAKWHGLF